MKAIVLAAGKGTRLRPITDNRPKHLLEIAGKSILLRILEQLRDHADIDQIVVVVNYKSEMIIEQVKLWFPDYTKDILFVQQKKVLGTGDAVHTALNEIDEEDQPFMVINGDVILTGAVEKAISEYTNNVDGIILGAKVSDPTQFGVLESDAGYLLNIIEKPKNAPENAVINAGLYIFPAMARSLFSKLELSSRGEKELTDVLDLLVSQKSKIKIVSLDQGWFDVGKPWQILEANEYLMKSEQGDFEIEGTVEQAVQIHGNVHVSSSARVRSGVYIEGPVYLDEGVDLGPNCYIRSNTYLGKDTRIGNGCEVKNSVIYHGTHAAHLSYIGDSIIGMNSNLGAGTITANLRHDGKSIKVTIKGSRENSSQRKLGVIMGDNVKTGIGVDILPGVKISSNTWINAGEVLTRDR